MSGDTSIGARESWSSRIKDAIDERLGRLVEDGDLARDDASSLGALLGISERPMQVSTLIRTLGWSSERLERAKDELVVRLPYVGMGMFEYLDESIQIGPLAGDIDWRQAQLDAISSRGVSAAEATFIRNLMSSPRPRRTGRVDLPESVRHLLKSGLVSATSRGFRTNVDLLGIHKRFNAAFVEEADIRKAKS